VAASKVIPEGVLEVRAPLPAGWTWAADPLACGTVDCPHDGGRHLSSDCYYCEQFLGAKMGPGQHEITVYCRPHDGGVVAAPADALTRVDCSCHDEHATSERCRQPSRASEDGEDG
jgi:hypothetical protein